jgi:hypothetical protein
MSAQWKWSDCPSMAISSGVRAKYKFGIYFDTTCLGLLLLLLNLTSIITMIMSRLRRAGHVARIGAKRNAYRILVRKPERKRPLGRPRWEEKRILKR